MILASLVLASTAFAQNVRVTNNAANPVPVTGAVTSTGTVTNTAANPVPVQSLPASAAVITPADGADLATAATRGIWVGVGGNVKVDMVTGGTGITFTGVPIGILAVQAKRVYATGTTATTMLALY